MNGAGASPTGWAGADLARPGLARGLLAFLSVAALWVGTWALVLPRSFYDDFPGAGQAWVRADGPFNEHLVRDVGHLELALAVISIAALVTLQPLLVRVTAVAWLVSSVPHLAYHATHHDVLEGVDAALSVASLAVLVVAAAALLVAGRPAPPAAGTGRGPLDVPHATDATA